LMFWLYFSLSMCWFNVILSFIGILQICRPTLFSGKKSRML